MLHRPSKILDMLLDIAKKDPDPSSGRLFTYIYETGDHRLRGLAHKAFDMFLDTNALDPTTFQSALFFEKELVRHARKLTHAGEDVVGTVTYGGTESIMLAVKAARWAYRKMHGASATPEIIVPVTGHPSIRKAAHYLDLRVAEAPVDPETKKVDPEAAKSLLSERTALVVVSAPNFPLGTVEPYRCFSHVTSRGAMIGGGLSLVPPLLGLF